MSHRDLLRSKDVACRNPRGRKALTPESYRMTVLRGNGGSRADPRPAAGRFSVVPAAPTPARVPRLPTRHAGAHCLAVFPRFPRGRRLLIALSTRWGPIERNAAPREA